MKKGQMSKMDAYRLKKNLCDILSRSHYGCARDAKRGLERQIKSQAIKFRRTDEQCRKKPDCGRKNPRHISTEVMSPR